MSSVSFILGQKNIGYDPAGMVELYQTQPAVRKIYQQAAGWLGMDVDTLLHNRGTDEQSRSRITSLSLAAAMVGIHDVLREKGIRPCALGGLSLGAMVASCLAGALSREELFGLLAQIERGPVQGGRREGIAAVVLPLGAEPEQYYADREGVWFGGDFGMHISGAFRMLLLTGYRDALDRLAAELPKEYMIISEEAVAAHCPLMRDVQETIARRVKDIAFADPKVPLCSSLERHTLSTASEVESMFVRNAVEPVFTDHLSQEMLRHGTRVGVVLGPTLPRDGFIFPFPVTYVDSPADITGVIEAMFANGVTS